MSKDRILMIREGLSNSSVINNILTTSKDKYITSILNEIQKTIGDQKKDLSQCSVNSIVSSIKQAHDLQLEIDGRGHCHLVKRNKNIGDKQNPKWVSEATLQVGYRGFIYAVKRAYPDANIDCRLVYEGDKFTLKKEGDITTYSLEVEDPFAKRDKIKGGFCYISYSLGEKKLSFCEVMNLSEINKIKNCAKSDSIWQAWFEEKAKVALIRRACKIHFSSIQQLSDLEKHDNEEFELKDVSKTANIPDNLEFSNGDKVGGDE